MVRPAHPASALLADGLAPADVAPSTQDVQLVLLGACCVRAALVPCACCVRMFV
jgi:hypothetical protein